MIFVGVKCLILITFSPGPLAESIQGSDKFRSRELRVPEGSNGMMPCIFFGVFGRAAISTY